MNSEVDSIIQKLSLSFFKGLQCNLDEKDIEKMTWENQEFFLKQTIQRPIFKKFPCNPGFSVLFFKKLIQLIELKHEVHDDIYEFLCSAMKSNNDMFIYHHYLVNNDFNNVITIKETKNIVVNGTTGLRTWEAALMLSDWALYNKEIFLNKNVLELGSGVGFTGITIAKQCDVYSMIMTDCHSEVLKTINDNIHINFPSNSHEEINTIHKYGNKIMGSMMLDWNDSENLSLQYVPDIVIGADIVYDPSILKPLINMFRKLQNINNNIDIYLASVIRNKDTFCQFLKELESSNLKHQVIPICNHGYIDWDESIERSFLKIN